MIANKIKPPITPDMKVAEFLKYYPELEETLIGMSSAFAKLKNPVLRRTVARVASLNQAAMVGDIAVSDLINGLRKAAGENDEFIGTSQLSPESEIPAWFEKDKIKGVLDARPLIEKGEQPLTMIISEVNKLDNNQIMELITPFYPAPVIDKVKGMGSQVWSFKETENLYRSYFRKQ